MQILLFRQDDCIYEIVAFLTIQDAIRGLSSCSKDWQNHFLRPTFERAIVDLWKLRNSSICKLLKSPSDHANHVILTERPLSWLLLCRLGMDHVYRESLTTAMSALDHRVLKQRHIAYKCAKSLIKIGFRYSSLHNVTFQLCQDIIVAPSLERVDTRPLDWIYTHVAFWALSNHVVYEKLLGWGLLYNENLDIQNTIGMVEGIRKRRLMKPQARRRHDTPSVLL